VLLRLFLRGVGQYSVGSLQDKRGRCLGLARVPERLPPPSLSPQLRRYLGLHILLFSDLRHVLSRDGDLRGTAEAPCAVLEFGKAKCGMHHGADSQEWATLGLKLNSLGFSPV
jgi:hypothetical protein